MKKIISCFMAVLMMLMCFVPVYAENSQAVEVKQIERINPDYPVVVIRGMDFGGLTLDIDTENASNPIKEFEISELFSTLGNALVAAVKGFSLDAGVDVIIEYVKNLMGELACDSEGNSVYNVTSVTYPGNASNYPGLISEGTHENEYGIVKELSDRYGAENVYFYVYDWRLNPLDMADDLNDTVNLACSEHNCSKVNVVCASMGGAQAIAYMTKYGYDKINRLLFMSAALTGTYVATDLFQGKVKITDTTLYDFAASLLKGNDAALGLLKAAKYTGILKIGSFLAMSFINKYKEKVYDDFLRDTFGTMPGFWGMIMEDEYEACYDYMFSGRESDYAGIAEISKALYRMSSGRDLLLKEAADNGVTFAVVANYNTPLIPVYERACANGDGTLETAPMSAGATIADYGKTLDVEAGKYISADKVIDASTCLFRDYTWFVKDAKHVACRNGSEYAEFMLWLLEAEGQPTVDSNPDYPQFLLSGEELTISPLK